MPVRLRATFQIGSWRFDPSEPALQDGSGDERRLEERAARTLELLCRRRGEVVTKAELLDFAWQGRTVSPNSLAIVIGSLRRALDDDLQNPARIVTINKRGYRLNSESRTAPAPARRRARWWALPVMAAVFAIGVGVATLRPTVATELYVEPTRNETGNPALAPLAAALNTVVMDSATHVRAAHVVSALSAKAPPSHGVALKSRLILWNGAPELALSAIDLDSATVIWTAYASGPPRDLARQTAAKVAAFQPALSRRPGR